MSRKKKKYDFQEKKYNVEIYCGIDSKKPLTVLKPENNYFCNAITLSRNLKENTENIKKFSASMKRGIA